MRPVYDYIISSVKRCALEFPHVFVYLKKPLQPSHVMALKWKPVALSPHTPQILGTFLSNSSEAKLEVLTTVDSITKQRQGGGREKKKRENKC